MSRRRVFDAERHIHFLTFSAYRRRKLLDADQAKRLVIGNLGSALARHEGLCCGFVVMPDHVHAAVWFDATGRLADFMCDWKSRTSSSILEFYRRFNPNYIAAFDGESTWQARYYDFNVTGRDKLEEKLNYMHENPVRAGLVTTAVDWPWSSARWYASGRTVGIPIRLPPGL